eukprot:TRINITY_DN6798_c0_g1_i1.p1 TRINITY_DN6798_c0_g1~~TRINITY_DN6798_c0_g1_i1.p1  ORF type:complete len:124 (+),score=2.50 TRINITY_DN6798_c0_g1_i1:340-711(+)
MRNSGTIASSASNQDETIQRRRCDIDEFMDFGIRHNLSWQPNHSLDATQHYVTSPRTPHLQQFRSETHGNSFQGRKRFHKSAALSIACESSRSAAESGATGLSQRGAHGAALHSHKAWYAATF